MKTMKIVVHKDDITIRKKQAPPIHRHTLKTGYKRKQKHPKKHDCHDEGPSGKDGPFSFSYPLWISSSLWAFL